MDEPLWQQYLRYMGNLAQGDFGPSFVYKDFSVSDLLLQGFPVSLQLGALAIVLALLLGRDRGGKGSAHAIDTPNVSQIKPPQAQPKNTT